MLSSGVTYCVKVSIVPGGSSAAPTGSAALLQAFNNPASSSIAAAQREDPATDDYLGVYVCACAVINCLIRRAFFTKLLVSSLGQSSRRRL